MAAGVIGALRDMVGKFKSGDILGALETMLDTVIKVVQTLGQLGVIKLPGAVSETGAIPRARGGPVVPGQTYLVGERGPEYVRFGNRGYVTPSGGGARRPYFDLRGAVMTQDLLQQMNSIGTVATGRGAVMGAAGAEVRSARATRRRIP